MNDIKKNKILFIIVEDKAFISHRLHLATYAMRNGYQVGLVCKISSHKDFLEKQGIRVFNWSLERGSFNLFLEMKAFYQLVSTLFKFSPDIIHAVAIKPVIYSAFASKITFIKSRVFALGGLGFIFSSERNLARILRPFVVLLLKIAFVGKKSRLIMQNLDDLKILLDLGVIQEEKTFLIKGAGVDTDIFSLVNETCRIPEVILPARLLWDKGVSEFVNAAKILKQEGIGAKFKLIGKNDPHNPESIPVNQLEEWQKEGFVEVVGFKEDMVKCLHECSIVCLPSYREGLPKSLLEAASCGRPIVSTDVPGCREIVKDGVNGYLVPPRDSSSLADALKKLIIDKDLRKVMGQKGRELVEKELSAEIVATETKKVWET